MYKCDNCQSSVRAHKQLSVFHAPNLLCVQLKRFRPGVTGKVGQCSRMISGLDLGAVAVHFQFFLRTINQLDPFRSTNSFATLGSSI
jgi:ubiquitin C-terminal hydrolase